MLMFLSTFALPQIMLVSSRGPFSCSVVAPGNAARLVSTRAEDNIAHCYRGNLLFTFSEAWLCPSGDVASHADRIGNTRRQVLLLTDTE